jgi:hypothetical protein
MTGSSRERWKALRDTADGLERLAAAEGFTFTYELIPEGTTNMEIELQEGESMADAVKRIAKEQSRADHAMDAQFIPTTGGLKSIQKVSKAPSKSPAKKVSETNVALMAAGAEVDEKKNEPRDIYSTVHVYKREDDTDAKVRWNANHEREMHGPNVLVYSHLHKFGGDCDSSCRVKVEAE